MPGGGVMSALAIPARSDAAEPTRAGQGRSQQAASIKSDPTVLVHCFLTALGGRCSSRRPLCGFASDGSQLHRLNHKSRKQERGNFKVLVQDHQTDPQKAGLIVELAIGQVEPVDGVAQRLPPV